MSESEQINGLKEQMEELQRFCHKAEKTLLTKKQYFKDHLAKLTIVYDPKWQICDICLTNSNECEDFLMKCQICNVAVHQSCYGPRWNHNDEDFLCFRCTYLINGRLSWDAIRCAFCPEIKGAIRPMFDNFCKPWCHKTCGNYIEGCWWSEPFGFLEHDVNTPFKWKTSSACSVCDSKYGRIIGCDFKNCTFKAHITCCIKIGMIREYNLMQSQSEKQGYDDGSYVLVIFCYKHLKKDQCNTFLSSVVHFDSAVKFFEKHSNQEGMFHYYDYDSKERTIAMNTKQYKIKFNEIIQNLKVVKKKKSKKNKDDKSSYEDSNQVSISEQFKSAPQPTQQKEVMDQEKFEDFKMMSYFCDEEINDYDDSNKVFQQLLLEHYKNPKEYCNLLHHGLNINTSLLDLPPQQLFEFLEPVIPVQVKQSRSFRQEQKEQDVNSMKPHSIELEDSFQRINQELWKKVEQEKQLKDLKSKKVPQTQSNEITQLQNQFDQLGKEHKHREQNRQTSEVKIKSKEADKEPIKVHKTKDGVILQNRAVKRSKPYPEDNLIDDQTKELIKNNTLTISDIEKKTANRAKASDFQLTQQSQIIEIEDSNSIPLRKNIDQMEKQQQKEQVSQQQKLSQQPLVNQQQSITIQVQVAQEQNLQQSKIQQPQVNYQPQINQQQVAWKQQEQQQETYNQFLNQEEQDLMQSQLTNEIIQNQPFTQQEQVVPNYQVVQQQQMQNQQVTQLPVVQQQHVEQQKQVTQQQQVTQQPVAQQPIVAYQQLITLQQQVAQQPVLAYQQLVALQQQVAQQYQQRQVTSQQNFDTQNQQQQQFTQQPNQNQQQSQAIPWIPQQQIKTQQQQVIQPQQVTQKKQVMEQQQVTQLQQKETSQKQVAQQQKAIQLQQEQHQVEQHKEIQQSQAIQQQQVLNKEIQKQVTFQEPEIKKKIKSDKSPILLSQNDKQNQKLFKMLQDTMNQLKFKRIFKKYEDEENDDEEKPPQKHMEIQIPTMAKLHIYGRAKAVHDKIG